MSSNDSPWPDSLWKASAVTFADVDALAAALWHDITAFDFGVCSTPQCVYVDPSAPVDALWAAMLARMPDQPPRADRLAARVAFEELLERHPDYVVHDDGGWVTSRWARSHSSIEMELAPPAG